ncbi:MAG TPA: hypothetical protein VHW03_10160 [Chthoniobacterales bacterium]|jgi:hypothetical protein|nr:hypothetical protein [Chthoniobacterales bacterium]
MNDTLIFLVLAGIALVFKWLTKMAAGGADKDSKPSPPNEQSSSPSPLSEQERVRRFLEALGAPPGTQLPPPVRSRSSAPPPPPVVTQTPRRIRQRKWEQPLPPLTTFPLPSPVVVEIPEAAPPPVLAAPPPLPPLVVPLPPSRRAAVARPVPSVVRPLGEMLRTRRAVRQAIVLREILGPPRGLQAPFAGGVSS